MIRQFMIILQKKQMKRSIFTCLFLIVSTLISAQQNENHFLQGYEEEISGKRFGYHSIFPDVNTSLLLRGRSDFEALVWKTQVIPEDYSNDFITFIWVFGMDVTATPVDFNLIVNDKKWFSFSSSKVSQTGLKTIKGEAGSELSFNVTMLDKYEDQMGFVILKLPATAITRGEPAIIKIETPTENNNAWFMTFKTQVKEKIEIYQNKVVVKDAGQLFHSVSVDFIHIGEDAEATIEIGNIKAQALLKAGYNKVEINLPKAEKATNYSAQIQIGRKDPIQEEFTISPIKEWDIFLVQHTHSDIGYTRPQTEILPEHLRYIDNAIDFCDQTDDYPDDAKFRWTCETSWSVREYLRSRPQEQIDRLLEFPVNCGEKFI